MRRKSFFYVVALILSISMLTSCTSEFDVPSTSANKPNTNSFSVSVDDAIGIANMLLPTTRSSDYKVTAVRGNKTRSSEVPDTLAYILNAPEGGFVVIASDKRMKPILAFSETGSFSYEESYDDTVYAFFIDRLSDYYTSCVEQSKNSGYAYYTIQDIDNGNPESRSLTPGTRRTVTYHGPYLSNSWDQRLTAGYSDSIQIDHPGKMVGCVAIATCQLMVHGTDSMTYHGIHYDFLTLKNNLRNPANDNIRAQAINTVAKLLADASEDLHMYYSVPGHEYQVGMTNVIYSINLMRNLGFDVAHTNLVSYNKDDMINYIDNHYLLFVKGLMYTQDNEYDGAHAFNCDGYATVTYSYGNGYITHVVSQSHLLHFDFGWGERDKGYYEFDSLTLQDHSSGDDIRSMTYYAVKRY